MSKLSEGDADAVRSWLARIEFRHVSSVGGVTAGFGDCQDVWERDGIRIRLTRDRGEWWYDLSRTGTDAWLDVDAVVAAMGYKQAGPVDRVEAVSSISDRVVGALLTAGWHPK